MVKTLLLCFIHGFKGDEETFFEFPSDLRNQVTAQNPGLAVQTRVYPKYETRGDLAACVDTFREWLQEQVISIERENGSNNPVFEPSVGVVLVAHSMGGFVAADTLFSIISNRPASQDPNLNLMFPQIHGLLAFDTPFNGLARSMFAYGAFSQYQNISGIWNILSTVSSSLPVLGASASSAAVTSSSASAGAGAVGTGVAAVSQARSWRRWQALAARTGTVGAIMAGGVAAYVHREQIYSSLSSLSSSMPKINKESLSHLSLPTMQGTKSSLSSLGQINYRDNLSQGLTYVSKDAIGEGFAWMASHLKFVGQLMKTAQLTTRLERLDELRGIGVANLYISLGENAVMNGGYFIPKRTFCAVPTENSKVEEGRTDKEKEKDALIWREIPNPKAGNEIVAHCSMFRPDRNAGYANMLSMATGLVSEWAKKDQRSTTVIDNYSPSREVLHRSKSESQLWDDDGKVLKPVMEAGDDEVERKDWSAKGGERSELSEDEDEKQLGVILQCSEMEGLRGTKEGKENDDIALKAALEVPLPGDEDMLPVDEEVDGDTNVVGLDGGLGQMGLEDATKVPLPEDEGVDLSMKDASQMEEKNTDVFEKKGEEAEGQEAEKGKTGGWGFRNSLPSLPNLPSVGNPMNLIYGGKKAEGEK